MRIDSIAMLISEIKIDIKEANELIKYKKSLAYRNKVLKEEQWLKNKWEVVIYLTPEKKYNKFTKEKLEPEEKTKSPTGIINDKTQYMTIFEKWIHFLENK